MKAKKFFGVLFTCTGCIAAFIGLATTVLPMIQNDQLQLVLASFETPSDNLLVSLMNQGVTYALRNCYLVMLAGAAVAVAGALLLLSVQNAAPKYESERRAVRLSDPSPAAKPPVTASTPIPAWRSSKAADVTEHNPYANPALHELLTPKAAAEAKHVSAFPSAEERASLFAPQKPGAAAASSYARPSGAAWASVAAADDKPAEPAPERSPYERPAGEAPKAVPSVAEEPSSGVSYPIGAGASAVAVPVAAAVTEGAPVSPVARTLEPSGASSEPVPAVVVPEAAFACVAAPVTAPPAAVSASAPMPMSATVAAAPAFAPVATPSVPASQASKPKKVKIKSTMGKHTI